MQCYSYSRRSWFFPISSWRWNASPVERIALHPHQNACTFCRTPACMPKAGRQAGRQAGIRAMGVAGVGGWFVSELHNRCGELIECSVRGGVVI